MTDKHIFAARLTPHRSLNNSGFIFVMLAVFVVSLSAGLWFYTLGAWPVLGFFGLDILLLYTAFRFNYRSANCYEDIILSSDRLLVRKVSMKGQEQCHHFNPYWVRLTMGQDTNDSVTNLTLRLHDRVVRIGSFLDPENKKRFGHALKAALKKT